MDIQYLIHTLEMDKSLPIQNGTTKVRIPPLEINRISAVQPSAVYSPAATNMNIRYFWETDRIFEVSANLTKDSREGYPEKDPEKESVILPVTCSSSMDRNIPFSTTAQGQGPQEKSDLARVILQLMKNRPRRKQAARRVKWTQKETDTLDSTMSLRYSRKQITAAFPNRTWDAVRSYGYPRHYDKRDKAYPRQGVSAPGGNNTLRHVTYDTRKSSWPESLDALLDKPKQRRTFYNCTRLDRIAQD